MKALSLRQPWAFAVLSLGKRLENRVWRALQRGFVDGVNSGLRQNEVVALHASRSKPGDADWEGVERAIGRRITDEEQDIVLAQQGHIIGTMQIVDILRAVPSLEIEERSYGKFPRYKLRDEDLHRYCGLSKEGEQKYFEQITRWWLGPYAFVLEDVHALSLPIAARGMLNFWQLTPGEESHVQRHLI